MTNWSASLKLDILEGKTVVGSTTIRVREFKDTLTETPHWFMCKAPTSARAKPGGSASGLAALRAGLSAQVSRR